MYMHESHIDLVRNSAEVYANDTIQVKGLHVTCNMNVMNMKHTWRYMHHTRSKLQ